MPKRIPKSVRDAVAFCADGMTVEELVEAFDVSTSSVRRIISEGLKPKAACLTVRQVAKLLSVSESHIYALVKEGALEAERHGRAIRITHDALEAYRQESRRGRTKMAFRHL